MCVIVGKYFPDKGWVGVKNRDRNYTPNLEFKIVNNNDTERLLFVDQMTGYKEGLNSNGVCILSASLMTLNDEKEITKSSTEHSPDGKRISNALMQNTASDALKDCISSKLTGNTIIFNRDTMFLLEACLRNEKYFYIWKQISKNVMIARTNHGIWLPWAGYQRNDDNENETLSRISSEARKLQAEYVVKNAITPQDLVDGLCQIYVRHPQLNIMRTDTHRKKMRTTAQEMMIPSERTMYCRPISSHIKFDFWELNKPNRKCWIELLSNRALWQNVRGDPPFTSNNMKHT